MLKQKETNRYVTVHSIYSVLGNHDYRGDVEAQLSPILRSMDSRWICMRSFIVDAGILAITFLFILIITCFTRVSIL
jgi:hypothetical protein